MWRIVFVVTPIVLGGIAAFPLLKQQAGYEWLTGICALLAGIAPAVSKALDWDQSLPALTKQANSFKTLQDKFRQAWSTTAASSEAELKSEFEALMGRMDEARSMSTPPPDRYFNLARKKIEGGDYQFAVDTKMAQNITPSADHTLTEGKAESVQIGS